MSLDQPIHRGGCQCGAVRFRIEGALGTSSICHCRMCQKAFGAFYAPLVHVEEGTLHWTTREPSRFQSSPEVKRGFCETCGTPLTYEAPSGVALATGAFDDPSSMAPEFQYGTESKLPYVDSIPGLAGRPTSEDLDEAPFLRDIVSFQHPDHD